MLNNPSFLSFYKIKNQNNGFVVSITGNSRLESIDFNYKTGNPFVCVGTISGDTNILQWVNIGSGGTINQVLININSTTTFYVSISGGTVDVCFSYRNNFW